MRSASSEADLISATVALAGRFTRLYVSMLDLLATATRRRAIVIP